jgi:hypothetical protein
VEEKGWDNAVPLLFKEKPECKAVGKLRNFKLSETTTADLQIEVQLVQPIHVWMLNIIRHPHSNHSCPKQREIEKRLLNPLNLQV